MSKSRAILIVPALIAVLAINASWGQSLSSSVIATAGEHYTTSAGSLSWTLGEVTSETLQSSAGIFTQGFQQPTTTAITGLAESDNGISIYPNPAREFVFVKTTENGDYQIELFNLQGQRVVDQSVSGVVGTQIHQIDLKDFRVALYLLRITNATTGGISIYRVEKY